VEHVESAVGSPYSAHVARARTAKNACALANSSTLALAQSVHVGDGSELATRYQIRGNGVLIACWPIRSRSPHSREIVARFDVTSAHRSVLLLDIDSSQLSYTGCDRACAVSVRDIVRRSMFRCGRGSGLATRRGSGTDWATISRSSTDTARGAEASR
jgi:hypothetical protein